MAKQLQKYPKNPSCARSNFSEGCDTQRCEAPEEHCGWRAGEMVAVSSVMCTNTGDIRGTLHCHGGCVCLICLLERIGHIAVLIPQGFVFSSLPQTMAVWATRPLHSVSGLYMLICSTNTCTGTRERPPPRFWPHVEGALSWQACCLHMSTLWLAPTLMACFHFQTAAWREAGWEPFRGAPWEEVMYLMFHEAQAQV